MANIPNDIINQRISIAPVSLWCRMAVRFAPSDLERLLDDGRRRSTSSAEVRPELEEQPSPVCVRSSARHGPRSTSAPDGFTAGAHVSFDRPLNASNIDKGVVGLLTGNTETFAGGIRELFYYAHLGCPGGEGRGYLVLKWVKWVWHGRITMKYPHQRKLDLPSTTRAPHVQVGR